MKPSPELIKAIKDRLALGHSQEEIKAECLATGYTEAEFTEAYKEATTEPESAKKEIKLTSANSLLGEGIQNWRRYLDLWLVLALALMIGTVAEYLITLDLSPLLEIALVVLMIGTFIAYMIFSGIALHVTATKPEKTTWNSSARWVYRHILPLVWLYILTSLVVWGGFFLFIIPGIIVSVYLYLSPYVLVHEEKRGEKAMLRSREIVWGHWWQLLRKLGLLFIYIFFFMLVVGAVATLFEYVLPLTTAVLAGELLLQAASAAIVIVMFSVGNSLYHQTKALPVTEKDTPNGTIRYRTLAMIGLLMILAMTALIAYLLYMGVPAEWDWTSPANDTIINR